MRGCASKSEADAFDRSSAMSNQGACVLAECYSCPFRVYSAKVFPGMSKSTDLTKVSARLSSPSPHRRACRMLMVTLFLLTC